MSNEEVVRAFLDGDDARSGNLRAMQPVLYSYAMPIALWINPALLIVTAPAAAPSATTKRHASMAAMLASVRFVFPPLTRYTTYLTLGEIRPCDPEATLAAAARKGLEHVRTSLDEASGLATKRRPATLRALLTLDAARMEAKRLLRAQLVTGEDAAYLQAVIASDAQGNEALATLYAIAAMQDDATHN